MNEQVEEKGYARAPAGSYLPMRAASATQQQQQRVAHQSPSPAPLRAANSFSGGSMVVSQNGLVNSRTGNPVILREPSAASTATANRPVEKVHVCTHISFSTACSLVC